MGVREFGDGDDDEKSPDGSGPRVFKDFDCPECSANNPYDDGFTRGDEVRCFYCGAEFRVSVDGNGRLRLKLV